MSKPKILLCLLCGTERDGWINPQLAASLVPMSHDPRFELAIVNIQDARPTEVARNEALRLARDNRVDWCLMFDNDNFTPGYTALDVIASAGPAQNVIGLTYAVPGRPPGSKNILYHMFPLDWSHSGDGQFQEVRCTAGGVLMIHKSVWEKIPRGPWFRVIPGNGETMDQSVGGGCGEDVFFSQLAREHGLRVWTHRKRLAAHFKSVDVTGMVFEANAREEKSRGLRGVLEKMGVR